MHWSQCREAAHAGHLSHAMLLELLEEEAGKGHWHRIETWLPILVTQCIASGERQGSAIGLASWLQDRRKPKLAQRLLTSVQWERADGAAWLLRGQVECSLGNRKTAEHHWIRALVLPGGQGNAAYRLGQLHRSKGQFDQAINWFLTALSTDTNASHIHHELQFIRCSKSILPELVAFYENLCQQQPEHRLFRQMLAHYLLEQGNLNRAIVESRHGARMGLGLLSKQLAPKSQEPTPPDFLILGTPKSGTTSLLHWLDQIPGVWCHPSKELHFFDEKTAIGPNWYCAQFPRFIDNVKILRGEATPNYFSHPTAPTDVAALMPKARLIVLLREPVARAVSWVHHLQRLEGLQGSVEQWLEHEVNALIGLSDEQLAQHPRIGTGALQDSCYDLHLQRWEQALPDNSLLLISSERLFTQQTSELNRLLRFLGLPSDPAPWLRHWKPMNVNPNTNAEVHDALRQRIGNFLAPRCQRSFSRADAA